MPFLIRTRPFSLACEKAVLCLTSCTGQRLQTMRKDKDPAAQVDIVASMNAAEHERDVAENEVSSEEE